jgi:hypothetical protein
VANGVVYVGSVDNNLYAIGGGISTSIPDTTISTTYSTKALSSSPTSIPTSQSPDTFNPLIIISIILLLCISGGGVYYVIHSRKSHPTTQKGKENPEPLPEQREAASGQMKRVTPPDDFTHHDVFITYSHKDKPVADAVCAALENKGIRCWIAPRDVLPGEDFPDAIIGAIDNSRIMVLIFSSSSNTSPHVIRELTKSVSKGLIIIPFRIEDAPLSKSMEYLIGLPHWLDAITPPLEKHIDTLVRTVEAILHKRE